MLLFPVTSEGEEASTVVDRAALHNLHIFRVHFDTISSSGVLCSHWWAADLVSRTSRLITLNLDVNAYNYID